jgi:PAS domain S-box-containing protein
MRTLNSAPSATDEIPADAGLLPRAQRFCAWAVWIVFAVTFITGFSNLLVWLLPPMRGFATDFGFLIMRANTSVSVTAAALSILAWKVAGTRPVGRWLAIAIAGVPVLFGGLTTFEYLVGIDLGIDRWVGPASFPGDHASAMVVSPGRMSLNASSSLFLLGLGLALLDWRSRRLDFAPWMAGLGSLPAFLGLVGHLLGQPEYTGILRSTNILVHTAVCMMLLALGIILLRPQRQPMRGLLSAGADGVLLRWLFPGSAAVLLSVAAMIGYGRTQGVVQASEGTALMLFGGMILLFALISSAGRAVRHQEESALKVARALREREQLSDLILETALDGVVLLNGAGEVVGWNAAAERIFGWRRTEMIGRPLAGSVLPPGALDELNQLVAERRVELSAMRRDGTSFPVEWVLNAVGGSQAPLFVAFVRDITDQKAGQDALRQAKERAEKASQAKDDFLAALSHELRTPLTPVLLSVANMAGDDSLPDPVRGQLAMIERNISLEARLIDDLLDLTRIAKGKLLLRREPCLLHDLLGHAAEIVRDEAQSRGLTLEFEFAARHSTFDGDPARLQQVFWNLLKNALKFTSPGGKVSIRTRDGAEAGVFLAEVRDTGIGFSAEAAEKLFAPFEQGAVINDHQFGGLGLGLAIARAIVDLHGGRIEAHSDGPGSGATFRIILPNASVPAVNAPLVDKPAEAEAEQDGSLRVLLVEDHEATRKVLTQLLTRSGHQVSAAASVAEAIAVMDGVDGFDVVVSDVGLPDGSGLDLLPQLRQRSQNLPGIALSGYGMEEDIQRSRAAGFAAHLVKPIKFQQLAQALRQARGRNAGVE